MITESKKVLLGIIGMFSAAFVVFANPFKVNATNPGNGSGVIVNIDCQGPFHGQTATGTVNYSYQNVGATPQLTGAYAELNGEHNGSRKSIGIGLRFDNPISNSASGVATYDFTVSGNRYTGTINLTPLDVGMGQVWLDGEAVLGSSAGTGSSDQSDFVEKMYEHINDTADEISLASKGLSKDGSVNATKTVMYSAGALNGHIVKELTKADGVTFLYTYPYAGYEFCSAVTPETARLMYREDIPWYGPCQVADHCPTVMIGPAK